MKINKPNPCSSNWNDMQYYPNQFQKILNVQRHKCVEKYFLRKKKRSYGTEYGEYFCRFGFPKNLAATSEILSE